MSESDKGSVLGASIASSTAASVGFWSNNNILISVVLAIIVVVLVISFVVYKRMKK